MWNMDMNEREKNIKLNTKYRIARHLHRYLYVHVKFTTKYRIKNRICNIKRSFKTIVSRLGHETDVNTDTAKNEKKKKQKNNGKL